MVYPHNTFDAETAKAWVGEGGMKHRLACSFEGVHVLMIGCLMGLQPESADGI